MSHALEAGMAFEFTYIGSGRKKPCRTCFPSFPKADGCRRCWPPASWWACLSLPASSSSTRISNGRGSRPWASSINVSHTAATPPGFTVTVKGRLEKVDGRKLSFALEASDGIDTICKATHDRFIIDAEVQRRWPRKKTSGLSPAAESKGK
ncbi:MAG: hypothetical protein MZU95_00185 [Desulfomicrobium escambiense]|nr:hypothetical protein [Desulfomicrobium escambiense]